MKAADIVIDHIEAFFNSLGMKTKLADYEINPDEAAEKIRDRFAKRGVALGEKGAINADVAYDIVKAS